MNNNKLAVVVGRFQTPHLHEGHQYLIEVARQKCQAIMIVVGVSGGCASHNDPLDFKTRAVMIQARFPDAKVFELVDHPSDEEWSNRLDRLIVENFPEHEPILIGSRDSFLPYYKGRHQIEEVIPKIQITSTELRQVVAAQTLESTEFRAGVIYANTAQNYPTSFQVVDAVIRHSLEPKVIVGRKAGEMGWRFPGGFVDPSDLSLELAVKRETREEVGDIEIDDIKYIRSIRINDYRYRKSQHKIMTALFTATYVYGRINAGDDLAEVRWQDINDLNDCLVEEHKPLAEAFIKELNKH